MTSYAIIECGVGGEVGAGGIRGGGCCGGEVKGNMNLLRNDVCCTEATLFALS